MVEVSLPRDGSVLQGQPIPLLKGVKSRQGQSKTTLQAALLTLVAIPHRNRVNSGSSLEYHILPLRQRTSYRHTRKVKINSNSKPIQTLTEKLQAVSFLKPCTMCLCVFSSVCEQPQHVHGGCFKHVASSGAMEGAHSSELGVDQQLSPPKSSLMAIFLKGFTPSLAH